MSGQTATPWLTSAQAWEYARVSRATLMRALADNRQHPERGLKCAQRGARSRIRIHVEDLERWMRGEAPSRGQRRLAVAKTA